MSDELKIHTQIIEKRIHLAYLKELYNSVELVDKEPNWLNCISLTIDKIENELIPILSIAADYLQQKNKIATKIAQTSNVIFIKMEKNNA